jgi:hypothetical protein
MEIQIDAIGNYFDYLRDTQIVSIVIGFFMFLILIVAVKSIFEKSKTKKYREDLTNLFVAGKIKQIAGKESIDLDKELKEFRIFEKKMNCSFKDLDDVVEDELKEQIQEDFENAKHN